MGPLQRKKYIMCHVYCCCVKHVGVQSCDDIGWYRLSNKPLFRQELLQISTLCSPSRFWYLLLTAYENHTESGRNTVHLSAQACNSKHRYCHKSVPRSWVILLCTVFTLRGWRLWTCVKNQWECVLARASAPLRVLKKNKLNVKSHQLMPVGVIRSVRRLT